MKIIYAYFLASFFFINLSIAAESINTPYWGDAKISIRGAQAAQTQVNYPSKIKDLFANKKIHVFSIDLDKNGKNDFIIHEDGAFKTCFAKSDLSIIGCEKLGIGDGFRYYWFVNMDGDPMLELISLEGDEDSSDYYIYRFDKKTWKMSKRIKIAPVIFSKSKRYKGIYWGYPWDITALITSNSTGPARIFACISDLKDIDEVNHEILFVAFEGIPTQGDSAGSFNYLKKKFKFMNLNDLKQRYEDISK